MSPAIVGLLAVIQLAGQERAVVKFSIGEERSFASVAQRQKGCLPSTHCLGQ